MGAEPAGRVGLEFLHSLRGGNDWRHTHEGMNVIDCAADGVCATVEVFRDPGGVGPELRAIGDGTDAAFGGKNKW